MIVYVYCIFKDRLTTEGEGKTREAWGNESATPRDAQQEGQRIFLVYCFARHNSAAGFQYVVISVSLGGGAPTWFHADSALGETSKFPTVG